MRGASRTTNEQVAPVVGAIYISSSKSGLTYKTTTSEIFQTRFKHSYTWVTKKVLVTIVSGSDSRLYARVLRRLCCTISQLSEIVRSQALQK